METFCKVRLFYHYKYENVFELTLLIYCAANRNIVTPG